MPRFVDPPRLFAALKAELRRPTPTARASSLMLIDIDGMTRVNARFGYRTGADLLLQVSRTLSERAPGDEILAHLGGDEFAIVLPGSGARVGIRLARRLLRRLRMLRVGAGTGTSSRVRASIGGASSLPDESSVEALMRAAHRALVEAKRLGGNRIVWSSGS